MTEPLCIKIDGAWADLSRRSPTDMVTNETGVQVSIQTLQGWSSEEQQAFGALRPDPPPATPEGKEILAQAITGNSKPVWAFTYGDIRSIDVLAVTPAQAKVALFKRGLLDQVKAIIDAQDYEPIKIFYNDATMWEKSNPYLQAIAVQLGLVIYDASGNEDATELDKVFSEASKL